MAIALLSELENSLSDLFLFSATTKYFFCIARTLKMAESCSDSIKKTTGANKMFKWSKWSLTANMPLRLARWPAQLPPTAPNIAIPKPASAMCMRKSMLDEHSVISYKLH